MPKRSELERAAGKEVLRLFFSSQSSCPLCCIGDHDNDGGERHEDECALRILDSLDHQQLEDIKRKYV
jgi:hypothetical protein